MSRNGIWVLVLLIACTGVRDGVAAEGYQSLFEGVPSKLTPQEKKQIYEQLEFRLADDGKFYVDFCDIDVLH